MDLKEGYYQTEIEEEHNHRTAFEFEHKIYGWNGMVMSYKNSPMVFQKVMNKVLGGLIGRGVSRRHCSTCLNEKGTCRVDGEGNYGVGEEQHEG
jgi:hypothetical protein